MVGKCWWKIPPCSFNFFSDIFPWWECATHDDDDDDDDGDDDDDDDDDEIAGDDDDDASSSTTYVLVWMTYFWSRDDAA